MIDISGIFARQEIGDILRKRPTFGMFCRELIKQRANASARIANYLGRPFFVTFFFRKPACFTNTRIGVLESMAEWTMPNVMQKGRYHRDLLSITIRAFAFFREFALDHLDQHASGVENAYAMGEPGMSCARENELGNTELFDTPQALELRCIQKSPS